MDVRLDNDTISRKITVSTEYGENELEYFRAKPLLYYLIQRANSNYLKNYVRLIAVITGVLRGYLPMVYFLKGFFPGDNLYEVIIIVILNLMLIIFYYHATVYILQSILDFRRKIYLMECLKRMIYKNKASTKRYVPNINILDITSAFTWYKMRRVVRYYGHNMTVRHEILIPAIFLYMIFIYMFNWIKNLDIIGQKEGSIIAEITPVLYVDYVVFTVVILFLFLTIAWVNYYTLLHIVAIQRVKVFINDLRWFSEHFFDAPNKGYSIA